VLVVLAHGADISAAWAAERLRARGRRVELVLVEWLEPLETTWRHELGAGGVRVDVRVATGRRVRTGEVSAVLNRVLQPPGRAVTAAVPGDVEYAQMELSSFAASWLLALAPVVANRPTPQGLSGRWRSPLHWRVLAQRAGLPVAPLALDSDAPSAPVGGYVGAADGRPSTTILTIGGEPLGRHVPAAVRAGARRLAAQIDTPILGVRFEGEPARDGWRVLDATPYPDLTLADEAGVEALDRVLAA
jgi:hypothetical protein